jgi:hypothetical protein
MNPTRHERTRNDEAAEFRDGLGFHPANTRLIQLAHECARLLAALMGTHLVHLLPNGREKSLAKTALEDVMMRANRSIALGKGPHPEVKEDDLVLLVADLRLVLQQLGAAVTEDPRIEAYKAEQRGEQPGAVHPLAPFEYRREYQYESYGVTVTGVDLIEAAITNTNIGPVGMFKIDEGPLDEDNSSSASVDDPEVLEEFASYVLTMASQLRTLKARQA